MIHLKPRALLRLGVLATLAVVAPVLAVDTSGLPPVSTKADVTYARDIRPIFELNCFPCHGPDRQRRRLRLDSLEAVLKGCEDGPVIFPGKSDQGDLILEICGMGDHDMPPYPYGQPLFSHEPRTNGVPPAMLNGRPAPKALTAEQIGLIRAWVAQGAK